MTESQQLLSDVVVYNKYAKFRPDLNRRENWEEIIDRYITMMLRKYCDDDTAKAFKRKSVKVEEGSLAEQIIMNSKYLYDRKVLPSMRALQFAGAAMHKNHVRGYNCAFMPMNDHNCFSELMFLLLSGTGAGYSVQFHHVEALPEIVQPTKQRKFLIGDSIEGWSDAIKALMKSYFGLSKYVPRFDFSDIREKGEPLITSGGKAPGPAPLKLCLLQIETLLKAKANGDQLTPLEVHDICCHIADAVLAGGIRRAALINMFSMDDREMLTCKFGNWWESNPQRGRANNSAVIVRGRVKRKEFKELWKAVKDSNSGEPGISFTNDPEYGFNPCHEISLRPFTFCNLTELNAGAIYTDEDLQEFSRAATFFGTLQAGFTDFHYLRPIWKNNTEKDFLVGVGQTGICNGTVLGLDLVAAANVVKKENERVAAIIGIKPASRTTTIKPSGTTSCVLGTSSGIHAWHDPFYIRNMQCRVGDDLYNYFVKNHPEIIKVMDYDPKSAVIGIPQKAPSTAILRGNETAIDFLERVKTYNIDWVQAGHRSGPNFNNVSATCSIDPTRFYAEGLAIPKEQLGLAESGLKLKDEWEEVGGWMWKNRNDYSGISVLPYDGGTYADAPFHTCTEYEYKKRMKYIKDNPIVLENIIEMVDNTDLQGELACSSGNCDLTY